MEDMARLAVLEQSLRDVDKFQNILNELLRQINHILENPHDNELRTIKSDILKDLLKCEAFNEYLKYVGFQPTKTEVIYPKEQTLNNLRMAQAAIERKICFCYGTPSKQGSVKISYNPRTRMLQPAKILTTSNSFLLKIESLFNNILIYEEEELLELARDAIPIVTLQLMALDRMREVQKMIKAGQKDTLDMPFDIALLMELMGWFKHKFFKWVDQPACDGCGGRTTFSKNYTVNAEKETCTMEAYICGACGVGSKFVRYNNPRTLLRTRRGRCGEWANCFTLLCRALGYETRFIYDTTDHVWCEIFDYDSNSWVHVDPCEAKLNAPLLYSHGWGKKLSYVIAVSRDDIQDVTWRYTMDHKEVLKRRTECTEQELLLCIMALRENRQKQVSEARRRYLAKRTLQELASLMIEKKPSDYETHGRISGSEQWRTERGEMGTQVSRTFEFKKLGYYTVRYFNSDDSYRVQHNDDEIEKIPTWSAGVYHAENVFRKVEHDWQYVYLARKEGSLVGSVSWRICAGAGLQLTQCRLSAVTKVFATGKLTWTLQYDDEPPEHADFDPEALSRGDVYLTRACRSLEVRVRLSGGEGGEAWQHAQLFRQPIDLLEAAFVLTANVVRPLSLFT